MKLFYWVLITALVAIILGACADKSKSPRILVLYYSQTSNTRTLAQEIAKSLNADIEEVIPVNPYDGDYQQTIQRAGQERETGNLPAIKPIKSKIAKYDIIFLGYPIWYGTYAMPIATLLNQINLNGKKVVPFCTFGNGGLVSSRDDIVARFPNADVHTGYGVRAARMDAVPDEVDYFLNSNGFKPGQFARLPDFSTPHPADEAESAIFDAAVGDYPMISAKAESASSRPLPNGTEYLFTAIDKPREGGPQMPPSNNKIYVFVLVENGKAPVFTQVVR